MSFFGSLRIVKDVVATTAQGGQIESTQGYNAPLTDFQLLAKGMIGVEILGGKFAYVNQNGVKTVVATV